MVENVKPITAACLSAGGGAFCAGLQQAGVKTLWANENNESAVEMFDAHYPDIKLHCKAVADLSVTGDNLAPVDILTAALPRRSFAFAVRAREFDNEHARFFSDVVGLLKEFGENRPPLVLLENVPYLMTGKHYDRFARIRTDLQFAGYWFDERDNCRVIKTKTGSRLFMVAASAADFYCNGFEFPQRDNRKNGNTPLHTVIQRLAQSCVNLLNSDMRCEDKQAA